MRARGGGQEEDHTVPWNGGEFIKDVTLSVPNSAAMTRFRGAMRDVYGEGRGKPKRMSEPALARFFGYNSLRPRGPGVPIRRPYAPGKHGIPAANSASASPNQAGSDLVRIRRSAFYRLATLVTASDIAVPLCPPLRAEVKAQEAWHQLHDEEYPPGVDHRYLVVNDGGPVGSWYPLGSLEETSTEDWETKTVGDLMAPLIVSSVVTSTTSYYDLVDLFARRNGEFLYFVIDGTEIVGEISYRDLFSRIGQAVLMALTLFLESAAQDLCMNHAKSCWEVLSPGRKEKAQEVVERREVSLGGLEDYQKYRALLKGTTFIDKVAMLTKVRLLGDTSNSELKSTFAIAERVRNLCAHGGDAYEFIKFVPQSEFARFLHRTLELIETMQRAATAQS